MKTTLFKIICTISTVVLLMSSCLGDSDSSIQIDRDFAYITTVDGIKCAATSSGYIVDQAGDVVSGLTTGKCYWIAYKITGSSSSNIYQAEYVNVLENGKSLPQENLIPRVPYSNVTEAQRNDSIIAMSMSVGGGFASDYWGDNWLINFSVPLKEDEKVITYFYYDADNQDKDESGKVEKNRIIVDVRFIKTNKNPENVNTSNKPLSAIGNLNYIRNFYQPDYDGKEFVDVPMKFRYQKYNKDGQPAEIAYIGSWNANSGSNVYFLRFLKK